MFFYILTALINAITSTTLGVFVYFKNRKVKVNQIFALFCFSVAFWSFGYYLWQTAKDANSALFWLRELMVGAIFIPIFYFHFILIFLEITSKKKSLIIGYLFAFLFFIFNFTSLFVKQVNREFSFEFWPKPGIAFHFFLVWWVFYIIYATYLLFKNYSKSTGVKKNQILYILTGMIIGYLGGMTNYFLWYGIPIPPVGNILVSVYVGMVAYAIVKQKLFDIKVILTELSVGAIAILLLVNFFTSESLFEYVWKAVLFFWFIIFGIVLIKSVLKEIKLTEKLQDAYQTLEKIDNTKSEFISIASHQLRTPLTCIKGYLSMLLEGDYGKLEKEQKEALSNVYQSGERLIKLTDELLDISRIELGKMNLNIIKTQIEILLQSCCEELNQRAKEKNLTLIFYPPKIFLPKVKIDELKIRQVILNLIDNAIRYTKQGKIEIVLKQKEKLILIAIRDTGDGLTEKETKQIFERFTRGSAGSAYFADGAGLGLYVAKKYIDIHQGKIWAVSPGKGRGATFFVELPIAD